MSESVLSNGSVRNPWAWMWFVLWVISLGPIYVAFQELALRDGVDEWSWLVIQGAMVFTGSMILANRPRNLIGRLLLGAGVTFWIGWLIAIPAPTLLDAGRTEMAGIVAAASNALASLWVMLVGAALFLFPDSHSPSPGWRWARWVYVVGAGLALLAPLANGGWGGDASRAEFSNPVRDALHPLGDVLSALFFPTLLACQLLAAAAILYRYVRSTGIERQQIKWLALAMLLLLLWAPIEFLLAGGSASEGIAAVLTSALLVFAMVSIGIGVLKYRLFEIDRILSRTVGYSLVVMVLGFVYVVGAIWLPARLIDDEVPPVFVAGSTLAVIALFNPVRKRVTGWIDRRFYRARYDAQAVVDGFGDTLRDEVEIDAITDGLVEVVVQTMQPETVGVWVRD